MSALVGAAHISFYRQWAAAGMTKQIPLASTTFGNGNEHIVTSPAEHNGIICSYAYFEEVTSPANAEFVKKFKAKYEDLGDPELVAEFIGMSR